MTGWCGGIGLYICWGNPPPGVIIGLPVAAAADKKVGGDSPWSRPPPYDWLRAAVTINSPFHWLCFTLDATKCLKRKWQPKTGKKPKTTTKHTFIEWLFASVDLRYHHHWLGVGRERTSCHWSSDGSWWERWWAHWYVLLWRWSWLLKTKILSASCYRTTFGKLKCHLIAMAPKLLSKVAE